MKTFFKALGLVLALTVSAVAAPINQGPIYIYQPLGGSSGGGGTGCVPAGSAGNILTDTGAGACGSDNSAQLSTGALTLGASGTLGSITLGNATSGTIQLQPVTGALGTVVLSLPAATDTIAVLAASQTFTNKTISGLSNTLTNIDNSSLTNHTVTIGSTAIDLGATSTVLAGLTSVTSTTFVGSLTGTASGNLTASNSATLTNKTYDTAGTGNSFSINGVAVTANTGTGSVVRATSPTLVTPSLGTPTALNLLNATTCSILTCVSSLGTNVGTFLSTPSSANLASAVTDETGSGALVFAASPTLTGTLSAAAGTFSGQLQGQGTNTNNNASTGQIGEFIESVITAGSATGLSSATARNVTSITLSGGDWDVEGTCDFTGDSTTTSTSFTCGFNTTTGTLPTGPQGFNQLPYPTSTVVLARGDVGVPVGRTRFSLSGSTTIYLVAKSNFATSTTSAYGFINARRTR